MADAEDFHDVANDLITDHVTVTGYQLSHAGSRYATAPMWEMREAVSGGAQPIGEARRGPRVEVDQVR